MTPIEPFYMTEPFKAREMLEFENLLVDTLHSFALEHGPTIRRVFRVENPAVPIAPLVEGVFLGRCAALLSARFGRDNVIASLIATLDTMESSVIDAHRLGRNPTELAVERMNETFVERIEALNSPDRYDFEQDCLDENVVPEERPS